MGINSLRLIIYKHVYKHSINKIEYYWCCEYVFTDMCVCVSFPNNYKPFFWMGAFIPYLIFNFMNRNVACYVRLVKCMYLKRWIKKFCESKILWNFQPFSESLFPRRHHRQTTCQHETKFYSFDFLTLNAILSNEYCKWRYISR